MKRFLLKVMLLLVMCLAVLFGLSRGYLALLNTDYERNESNTLQFKFVPDNLQIACLGSSHAGNAFQSVRYDSRRSLWIFSLTTSRRFIPRIDLILQAAL